MASPIQSLERIVEESLVARGMTQAEAANAIEKLKSAEQRRPESPSPRNTESKSDMTFQCDVIRRSDSDLALLLKINGEDVWLPVSQFRPGSDPYGGTVTIPLWLATAKDLVG